MPETQCIKALYRLAEFCPVEHFQQKAFEELKKLIFFDTAGWCEGAILENSVSILRAHFSNLPHEYKDEYNEVQHLNPISPDLYKGNSNTQIANLFEDEQNMDQKFKAFVDKYKIHRFLYTSTTHESGLFLFIIALTRKKSEPPFSQHERRIKQKIMPHFIESYRHCRRIDFQRKLLKSWELNRGFATCDQQGILHDADDYFIDLLKLDWPDSQAAMVPRELMQSLLESSFLKTKESFYRYTLVDDLYLLTGTRLKSLKQLSEREFQIAYIYSNGSTSKEIASQLSISPITVKNHVAKIYDKLKLDSKEKLKHLFISNEYG